MSVLAINKHYIPIRTTSAYSAIGKMYCGLADALFFEGSNYRALSFDEWLDKSMYDVWPADQKFIQAVRQPIAIPRVIIYTKYDKIPKPTLKLTRKAIYERDNYTCYICGKEFGESKLTLDHIIPMSRGGKNSWENLITCCQKCNWEKGDKLLSELKIKPHFVAYKPSTSNIQRLKAGLTMLYPEWSLFI
jgi:5-methylcytosine-specific restriction endonuclease McrA